MRFHPAPFLINIHCVSLHLIFLVIMNVLPWHTHTQKNLNGLCFVKELSNNLNVNLKYSEQTCLGSVSSSAGEDRRGKLCCLSIIQVSLYF